METRGHSRVVSMCCTVIQWKGWACVQFLFEVEWEPILVPSPWVFVQPCRCLSVPVPLSSCIGSCHNHFDSSSTITTFTCRLTARIVWAPQMTSQPVSSIFLRSSLLAGTWRTLGQCSPWCCLPHFFFCLPCLLPPPSPHTVPCKLVLARPDERETDEQCLAGHRSDYSK